MFAFCEMLFMTLAHFSLVACLFLVNVKSSLYTWKQVVCQSYQYENIEIMKIWRVCV